MACGKVIKHLQDLICKLELKARLKPLQPPSVEADDEVLKETILGYMRAWMGIFDSAAVVAVAEVEDVVAVAASMPAVVAEAEENSVEELRLEVHTAEVAVAAAVQERPDAVQAMGHNSDRALAGNFAVEAILHDFLGNKILRDRLSETLLASAWLEQWLEAALAAVYDSLLDSDNLEIGCQESREHLAAEQETLGSSGRWEPAVVRAERGEAQTRTVVRQLVLIYQVACTVIETADCRCNWIVGEDMAQLVLQSHCSSSLHLPGYWALRAV